MSHNCTIEAKVAPYHHFLSTRAYKGTTNWQSFKNHFERCCKVNNWTTNTAKLQHLMLSLEGAAAECLRDIDDTSPTALEDIWSALSRRFGDINDQRDAQRKFDVRKQQDNEGVAEFEQALRTLYRLGWPTSTTEHKDQTLKRRFEDGLLNADLTQYLRLHATSANFTDTVQQARRFLASTELQRTKSKVVRTSTPSHDSINVIAEPEVMGKL